MISEETMQEFREALGATRRMPRLLYEEDGLLVAIVATPVLPIAAPLAAVWWFSIDKDHREAIEEWNELTE